jgi:DNA polymerase I-like protein with 3'-5' exonuclease and polymerase domains
VEKNFWNERFPVYNQWRKDWYSAYTKKGHFQSLTGFNYTGAFRRNQVINLPVQGSASHLKLQALVNLQEELVRSKMDSRLILEIHDSVIGLVKDEEFDDYCQLMQEQMVRRVNQQFPWLAVPVKIEVEASPSGGSWHEKSLVHL